MENVPEELYEALVARSRATGTSISAEVLALLAENVLTPNERVRREEIAKRAQAMRAIRAEASGPFATAEELQRGDRAR